MQRSYNPSYNRNLTRRTYRPIKKAIKTRKSIGQKLGNVTKFIDPETNDIVDIRTSREKVKSILIHNLKKSNRINIKNIVPPKQCGNNCWFNVLFLCYFISDKGRRFTKPLRQLMITGDVDKRLVDNSKLSQLTEGLFLLNLAIEATLTGVSFTQNINTNEIISTIYDSFKNPYSWTYNKGYGNPLVYYEGLVRFLYTNNSYPIQSYDMTNIVFSQREILSNYTFTPNIINNKEIYPHMLIITIDDNTSSIISNRPSVIKFTNSKKKKTIKYKLDSICIRDIDKSHVGCLINLNKCGFFFDADGPQQNRMSPKRWLNKNFLSSNRNFTRGKDYATFNIRNGYQILYYFRDS